MRPFCCPSRGRSQPRVAMFCGLLSGLSSTIFTKRNMAVKKQHKPRFEHPDNFLFDAAVGWSMLGNSREAVMELQSLTPAGRDQPEVLELLWQLHAELNEWAEALAVAERLIEVAPKDSFGWVHRAYSLRRSPEGGLEKAWHVLRPAADLFPGEKIIPYNLACYAAQMNRLDEAWSWLQKAMDAAGEIRSIKAMASVDEDLKPLWDRIAAL
jgi:tetratricopeptide (TPR) repeat protein